MKKRLISILLAAALMAGASSCSGGSGDSYSASPASTASTGRSSGEKSSAAAGAESGGSAGASADGGAEINSIGAVYDESYDAAEYSYDASFAPSEEYSAAEVEGEYYDHDRSASQARAGLLTGGEWRDNSNFAFWRSLFAHREEWRDIRESWNLNTSERVFVRVKDTSGAAASGLTVKLAAGSSILWQSVTDSRGEAFLFADIAELQQKTTPDKIIVETSDGRAVTADVPKDNEENDTAIEITMPDPSPMRTKLDLMMMIDTTGSMGDELRYLQTELESVINRVSDAIGSDIQLSVNFYRDNEDDYVVRDFGFTKNISIALDHLSDQRASGGGDYPEAVTKALSNGINGHDWRSDTEKLMFLVLDAPPHKYDAADLPGLIQRASELGIRIIPVASSGVDTDTEFLCRSLAIATGGTYTFLTDDSGIGYSHLEPTIGSYEVEKLNDMLVRIIKDYFSSEPRVYNTQKPSEPEQPQQGGDTFPAVYAKTHDYYSGEGYYRTGIIRSAEEAAEFIEKYGDASSFSEYAENVDFDEYVIAYKVESLGSGSITVNSMKPVTASVYDGRVSFSCELDIPEVGTADMAALFFFAQIPAGLV